MIMTFVAGNWYYCDNSSEDVNITIPSQVQSVTVQVGAGITKALTEGSYNFTVYDTGFACTKMVHVRRSGKMYNLCI